MGAIKAIVDAVASTIKNAAEGTAQAAQSGANLDLQGAADGACQAMGLDDDDSSQSAPASQASNTLIEGELARIQAMLAQNAAGQQNGGGDGGGQSFGGMRA